MRAPRTVPVTAPWHSIFALVPAPPVRSEVELESKQRFAFGKREALQLLATLESAPALARAA